jgi:hypothetical protein
MQDDAWVTAAGKVLFVVAEVKADVCSVNGPWSRPEEGNMERAIRRLGFAPEEQVAGIAQEMYRHLCWEGPGHALQYVAVGSRANHDLGRKQPMLRQITWEQISNFLFERFTGFPPKLRSGGRTHDQWPDFGKKYGEWFYRMGRRERSVDAVLRYIETGRCLARRPGSDSTTNRGGS